MNFKRLLATAAFLVAPMAQASFVTIDEASLDAIYSQASFGANKVDIRIGLVSIFTRPDLLNITADSQIVTLFNLHVGGANVVNFYFVDTIDSCGIFNVNIIGCGETPGNDFVVESAFAADNSIPAGGNVTVAGQLLAHELGHNLGLNHRNGNFLMNPFINGFGELSAAEVAEILLSPLIQVDANGQRYIQINPVLITNAALIPEPSGLALAGGALLLLGLVRRKRSARPLQA